MRTFQGPSWLLCFLSLEFCYICYFCDFCDICHGCFRLARKILVTFAIFAIIADISGPFLASLLSKSGILLHLLFLLYLRYLSQVFLARKKNPRYFSDFCNNCGHFGALLGLSLIHISEPTRRTPISYAVFCLKKKILIH